MVLERALRRVTPVDREIPSELIIELAAATHCSAYDCEYVVLAQMLHLKLVTGTRRLPENFLCSRFHWSHSSSSLRDGR